MYPDVHDAVDGPQGFKDILSMPAGILIVHGQTIRLSLASNIRFERLGPRTHEQDGNDT